MGKTEGEEERERHVQVHGKHDERRGGWKIGEGAYLVPGCVDGNGALCFALHAKRRRLRDSNCPRR